MQTLHEALGGLMNELSDKLTPEQFELLNEVQEKVKYYTSGEFSKEVESRFEQVYKGKIMSLKASKKAYKRDLIILQMKVTQLTEMLKAVI